jgi:hypothetical protein
MINLYPILKAAARGSATSEEGILTETKKMTAK